ncbi:MAG: response regulator [Bacteroidetes bacterium]|nr:response regulator [Bacteroidota bacterium]
MQESPFEPNFIEAILDPMFTIHKNGNIKNANFASSVITGCSIEKLIGSNFANHFSEPEKVDAACLEIYKNGSITHYPLVIKDHKLTDVLLSGSIYNDANKDPLGILVSARDISSQRKIESDLMEAIVFAEFSTALAEEAKAKAESATLIAESAVRSKQQFLSNMSHEIRTPMNAIIGFTKVVLNTELSVKQKEYLNAIKLSGDALVVLINDILDLAKVDSGKMTFEQTPFRMSMSISSMLHLFEPKIQEKNLALVKEYDEHIPEVLIGDAVRLHQIILNLVSNAVKFTNTGKITVSVKLIKEDDVQADIQFSVSDTGIGIPEAKIGQIFENFQQASSGTSRLYGGTGLGLAIVKQLVEIQGGVIQVKSVIDEGSTFSFILSFKKTSTEMESEVPYLEKVNDIQNVKVLVVEDIPLNQLLMKTLLDDFGFENDIASNGLIAIEKLKLNTYDLILMDLQMPELNGFETTEYIRNTLGSTIPIIALTADVTTVDLDKCRAVGMNDYLSKPVDEKLLYKKIVGFVKRVNRIENMNTQKNESTELSNPKFTNLAFLYQRTKANNVLIVEMINAYLSQTPALILELKNGFEAKNWKLMQASAHKMIPSFSIMGISTEFEDIARKVQNYALMQIEEDRIHEAILQLESVCLQACDELKAELHLINTRTHE